MSRNWNVLDGNSRVIIHLDVDCFEVQVWLKHLHPQLLKEDKPLVITSPNKVVVSVNYTAKSLGVKRGEGSQGLDDAWKVCERAGLPLLDIVVPKRYGKIDTFLPLTEGNKILYSLFRCPQIRSRLSSIIVERSSRDELTIDVTQLIQELFPSNNTTGSTFVPSQRDIDILNELKVHPNATYNGTPTTVMECCKKQISGQALSDRIQNVYRNSDKAHQIDELRLIHGAIIANDFIQHIKRETGYDVSAGVGHSKLVAKLACGRNKPKGITIMTDISLSRLSTQISFQNLPGFGGKIGDSIQELMFVERFERVESIDDLLRATNYNDFDLIDVFQEHGFNKEDSYKRAADLYSKCIFKDDSPVISKVHPDTITTTSSFKGCKGIDEFTTRISSISKDMEEKLNYYKRYVGKVAGNLVVKMDLINSSVASNTNCRRDLYNVMPLQPPLVGMTYGSVNRREISQFIWNYIIDNGFHETEIDKIYLIAKNMTDVGLRAGR